MARNSKKKLAIFAGTSKCLIYNAEAKYCASDMPGEIKYYECSRTEYCCAFGCCVSPGLHFHHLWYYWILVIIMFLVCSGGGWWYRYWLQGRYRAAASAIPTRSPNARSQNSLRNAPCQAQQARITYNSARNTVLLHRMWKGPPRNAAAPMYNDGSATTSTHYQNMNVVFNDASCPYYQLYGPPPSYETVIAQTRGKIPDPASSSPESSAARLNLQAANVIPNPSVPQCFFYACNSPSRLADGDASRCPGDSAANSRSRLDDREGVLPAFAHFSQYCAANDAVGQSVCAPLGYSDSSTASGANDFGRGYQSGASRLSPEYPMSGLSDISDNAENAQGFAMQLMEGYNGTLGTDNATGSREILWNADDRSALAVHGAIGRKDGTRVSQRRRATATAEAHVLSPKSEASADDENERRHVSPAIVAVTRERSSPWRRMDYGGSLRLPRKHAGGAVYHGDGFQRIFPKDLSSVERSALVSAAASEDVAPRESREDSSSERDRSNAAVSVASPLQSNPSNNVILERFIFANAPPPREYVDEARGSRAINRSTNFDLESKHKLDRSKSLD